VTAIPAGAELDSLVAFDTGPANMVVDYCMATLLGSKFDRNGAAAKRGRVLRDVVERAMRGRYFSALPPKSCGREEFGTAFSTELIRLCRKTGGRDEDVVATATALTAESVVSAYRNFVRKHLDAAGSSAKAKVELCVAGGGARNATLMAMLREGFAELDVRVRLMEELGVPAQAKEGVAFALLAWLTWNGLAGNVPAATGASRQVVLGKVNFPG
jgi:anhydro-N-acetylmuramic acid kinase